VQLTRPPTARAWSPTLKGEGQQLDQLGCDYSNERNAIYAASGAAALELRTCSLRDPEEPEE
jgi:hypothetical protein